MDKGVTPLARAPVGAPDMCGSLSLSPSTGAKEEGGPRTRSPRALSLSLSLYRARRSMVTASDSPSAFAMPPVSAE